MSAIDWDGLGAPPIGIVCEYLCEENNTWKECDVVAYYYSEIIAVDTLDNVAVNYPTGRFRAIRTPEQHAEFERKQAIEVMKKIVSSGDGCGYETLYDAGYRKTEVKK